MKIFLQLPFTVSIIILTVICVSIFLLIDKLTRNKLHHELLIENHTVSGFIYNAVCFIYAVLIAFVVYVIWTNFEETNSKIESEANNLLNLYYDANAYPDTLKKEIQATILEYVKRVTNEEWKSLANGNADQDATKAFIKLNRIFLSIDTKDIPNTEVLNQSIESMKEIREFRRHRILSSKQSMPDILWIVLIFSSIVLIAFTFFFSVKNIWQQNIMVSFLIFIIVLVLYLIYVMDYPYVGMNAVKPDAFQPFIEIMNRMGK